MSKLTIVHDDISNNFISHINEVCKINELSVPIVEGNLSSGLELLPESEILLIVTSADNIIDNNLFEVILNLRKTHIYQELYICCIFENQKQIEENVHFSRCGINYFMVQEGDTKTCVTQMIYLACDEPTEVPKHATTRKFYIKTQAHFMNFIISMSEFEMTVASDMLIEQEVEQEINYLEVLKSNITYNELAESSTNSFSSFTYKVACDHPTAWDESEYSSWDTISTQVSTTLIDLKPRLSAYIIGDISEAKPLNIIQELSGKIVLQRADKFNPQTLIHKENAPSIIFFNKDLEANDENMDELLDLISVIKAVGSDYEPFIIVTSCPSATKAMQRVASYQKLMCTSSSLNYKILANTLALFLEKNTMLNDTEIFPLSNKHSIVHNSQDIIITQFSESKILFLSEVEIPLYSIFQLDIGMRLNLIVVPPPIYLDKVGNKMHYMCFIMGLNNETLKRLRRAVNKLMYIEVEDIKVLSDMLSETGPVKDEEPELEQPPEQEEQVAPEKEEPKKEVEEIKTKSIMGYKSKI